MKGTQGHAMANIKRNQLSTLKVKNISAQGAYTDGGAADA